MVEDDVCPVDGVAVGTSGSGRLIHLDELPRGTEDHVVDRVPRERYETAAKKVGDLEAAISDFMQHHASVHPSADCQFLERVSTALRAR